MTRLWLHAVLNLCAWLFAMTFAMATATALAIALAMAISTAMAWLQLLPWDRASIVLLRVLFSCNLLGICMVDDGGDVFGSLRVDMGSLAYSDS